MIKRTVLENLKKKVFLVMILELILLIFIQQTMRKTTWGGKHIK